MAKAATKSSPTQNLNKPEENKEIAASPPGNLPATPGDDSMFEGDRSGFENVTAKDVVIPRMTILQKLSPQLDRARPEFIEGAIEGDFCNTATGDLYKDQIEVVPCHYAVIYLEWAPRNTGKGLQMNHGTDDSILRHCKPDDKRRMVISGMTGDDAHRNGNYVQETATYYCLLLPTRNRIFIPLASTQLKNSRKWMTLLSGMRAKRKDGTEFQPPLYFRSWIAVTTDERNPEGAWKGWKFSPGQKIAEIDPTLEIRNEAKRFHEDASSGLVRGEVVEDEHQTVDAASKEKEAF